jgi:sec-independent protein translocase protein TatC
VDEREYSLIEHLGDLRGRLVRAGIGIFAVAIGAFAVSEGLLDLLRIPVEEGAKLAGIDTLKFVAIAPAEYFIAQLKVAFVVGIFLSSPWSLYQIWLFVAPGLYHKEQKWVVVFVGAGSLFFISGALFAYQFVFPPMFKFFLVATNDADIEMTLSVAEHFSFSLKLLIAFGLVFQTPVIVFVLSMTGLVDPSELGKYRIYVVVGGFVIGAMLTPPDILSQTMLAMPLVVLFEGGMWASRLVLHFRKKKPTS